MASEVAQGTSGVADVQGGVLEVGGVEDIVATSALDIGGSCAGKAGGVADGA